MEKLKRIEKAIKKFDNFLVASHVNPEGDSLCSQLAVASLLRSLGKRVTIYNSDNVPRHLRFLPDSDLIRTKIDPKKTKFDCAIIVDCPNLRRTGKVESVAKNAGCVINIDHHVSNEKFGDIDWVDKNASSAGEMIYRLYKSFKSRITKKVALYLYIAILTDTGSFNYSNTSGSTHDIISELMSYGVMPYDVSKSVYENKTIGGLRLLGRALSNIRLVAGGKIAYTFICKRDFRETKAEITDCENFVNFARSIEGVYAAVFFRDDTRGKNSIHVSLRSKKKVDVNKVASHFGGGGHAQASGCVLEGSLEEVRDKVLKRVQDEL